MISEIIIAAQLLAGSTLPLPPPPKDPRRMQDYKVFLQEVKQYPGRERWTKQEWDKLKQRSTKTPLVPIRFGFGRENGGLGVG